MLNGYESAFRGLELHPLVAPKGIPKHVYIHVHAYTCKCVYIHVHTFPLQKPYKQALEKSMNKNDHSNEESAPFCVFTANTDIFLS